MNFMKLNIQLFAHVKAQGSTKNGRDSAGRRLGAKAADGETVSAGSILYRQRGTRIYPGTNVGIGKDDTLFAKVNAIRLPSPIRCNSLLIKSLSFISVIWQGQPKAVTPSGISFNTTLPAPIVAHFPIFTPCFMQVPTPIHAPSPMFTPPQICTPGAMWQ